MGGSSDVAVAPMLAVKKETASAMRRRITTSKEHTTP
jgi:hypothetical protein